MIQKTLVMLHFMELKYGLNVAVNFSYLRKAINE